VHDWKLEGVVGYIPLPDVYIHCPSQYWCIEELFIWTKCCLFFSL